jgi:NitT/TauT family transport system substrate-binding protein
MARLLLAGGLLASLLAACGGSAAAPRSSTQPEKAQLNVTVPSDSIQTVPIRIAQDSGAFKQHGLDVTVTAVSAAAAVQGMTSGSVDMYQGGATAITADLAGGDFIYVMDAIDRTGILLVGQKGLSSFQDLRGKSVSTSTPGASGEIAIRLSAKQSGVEIGKDIKLIYHPNGAAALATFVSGQADALLATSAVGGIAQTYPVLIDYRKQGLKLVSSGLAVTRDFYAKNPNTVKAYIMGYLDGLKRALDDKQLAQDTEAKYAQITDRATLDSDYRDALEVWNRDVTVDPLSIQNVLDGSSDPKAQAADASRFYDNTLVQTVNREYAVKLFPNEVKPK